MESVDIPIRMAVDSEEIRACYQTMRHLRPHLVSEQTFVEQTLRQIRGGYHLVYIIEEEFVRPVAGYRFLECLAWGKVLYLDDLVTDAESRKRGYGGKLLKWLMGEAKKAKCDQVHLDSGPQRNDAHRLYLNSGFKIIGHHFALEL